MIRTQEEYTDACNFIDSDMELYDFQLSEKMSSYEYNLYLQDTEYFLNFLYEKIRVLEELCDYLDDYIDIKSNAVKDKIKEKTEILNTVLSKSNDKQSSFVFPLWDISETLLDRDGSVLAVAEISGNMIEGASRKENYIKPIAVQRCGEKVPYADNCDRFVKTDCYITKYNENAPVNLKEDIQIVLPNNVSFNCIEYDPLNAKITVNNVSMKTISISMAPKSYEKGKQIVQYSAYADDTLDTVDNVPLSFKKEKTAAENINTRHAALKEKGRNQFKHKIQKMQGLSLKKNKKSELIYNQ